MWNAYLNNVDQVWRPWSAACCPIPREAAADVRELVRYNRAKVTKWPPACLYICRNPMPFEQILSQLFQCCGLTCALSKYVWWAARSAPIWHGLRDSGGWEVGIRRTAACGGASDLPFPRIPYQHAPRKGGHMMNLCDIREIPGPSLPSRLFASSPSPWPRNFLVAGWVPRGHRRRSGRTEPTAYWSRSGHRVPDPGAVRYGRSGGVVELDIGPAAGAGGDHGRCGLLFTLIPRPFFQVGRPRPWWTSIFRG